MTVPVFEFIRRFLLHVLPNGFTKIRHFGLLSSRAKPLKLLLCKKLTNTLVSDKPKKIETPLDLLKRVSGVDFTICPCSARYRTPRKGFTFYYNCIILKMPLYWGGGSMLILP